MSTTSPISNSSDDDDNDFVCSSSDDSAGYYQSDVSASLIFNQFAKKKKKVQIDTKDQDKDNESEYEREREKELQNKIEKWKETGEYMRLGAKAREMIENAMRKECKNHSKTIMLLTKIIDKYETLWPTGESRVPFFVQHFEMR